jgi:hypothetical protein
MLAFRRGFMRRAIATMPEGRFPRDSMRMVNIWR